MRAGKRGGMAGMRAAIPPRTGCFGAVVWATPRINVRVSLQNASGDPANSCDQIGFRVVRSLVY